MHAAGCYLLQSLRSCVSEVILAIDSQLSKQEDLQKKKVWLFDLLSDFIIWSYFDFIIKYILWSPLHDVHTKLWT